MRCAAAVLAALLAGDVRPQATSSPQQEYTEVLRQADAWMLEGNAFEAVRLYERAGRIAYNNKLPVDDAALKGKRPSWPTSPTAPTT